jgi:hypothetical protein
MLSFLNHSWKRLLKRVQELLIPKKAQSVERGQVLVIMVIAFTALLAFVGMVSDIGAVYVTFTQLKRAVDAAALSAANNIKNPNLDYTERKTQITEAAREMLAFHNVTDIASLEAYTCEDTGLPAEFDAACPDVGAGESPRKLAWVQATQNVPVYFLSLFGIESIPLTTRSIGEAATVDMVIVIDSSESMGNASTGYTDPVNFNPSTCNANNTCQPLKDAKDAAKNLVDSMFEGYDQISVVQFDFDALVVTKVDSDGDGIVDSYFKGNFTDVKADIDSILLHDDIDRNTIETVDELESPYDAHPFDLDSDGCLGDRDDNVEDEAIGEPCEGPPLAINDSYLSTCTGCAIRVAGTILKQEARPNSVWVIVFLTDGVTNVSDIPPEVDSIYTYGYCFDSSITWCQDKDPATRHCGPYHADASECPPGSTWVGDGTSEPYYDVEDYAYDMVDEVALTASTNPDEPINGNNIAIYSIALGKAADADTNYVGEELLRYMANVGDDGTRLNDPCAGVAPQEQCGNYYYAPSPSHLARIFESIAARIYTRISY